MEFNSMKFYTLRSSTLWISVNFYISLVNLQYLLYRANSVLWAVLCSGQCCFVYSHKQCTHIVEQWTHIVEQWTHIVEQCTHIVEQCTHIVEQWTRYRDENDHFCLMYRNVQCNTVYVTVCTVQYNWDVRWTNYTVQLLVVCTENLSMKLHFRDDIYSNVTQKSTG